MLECRGHKERMEHARRRHTDLKKVSALPGHEHHEEHSGEHKSMDERGAEHRGRERARHARKHIGMK